MNFAIHSGISAMFGCHSASGWGSPDWRQIAAAGASWRRGHDKGMNIHH
jgi:hypothetical protein